MASWGNIYPMMPTPERYAPFRPNSPEEPQVPLSRPGIIPVKAFRRMPDSRRAKHQKGHRRISMVPVLPGGRRRGVGSCLHGG
ncbi:hypothetical protein Cob_v001200 [Colletotrichum orbiculare MAFF 240422]|uniref:Uncharacterized protein n=1 Tax=Colletotrichum orbiculare (strain 104-T / ATCC 96160 / CBS 514.97 / LARS 414 / MAFF 240422) TaxID=1213857 RepID=A0A484G9J3_COLOR|nr:hypothetical protein Cob_v001200 [Colletotrichum orbiculare MAFF 240422]